MLDGKKNFTEDELILLISNGNKIAFDYLYDNYYKALYVIITKIVLSKEDAEDVLQNVFVKIWNSFSSYNKEKGRLYTWMLNIARNAAIDYARSKQSNNDQKKIQTDNLALEVNKFHSQEENYDYIGFKKILTVLKTEHQQLIDLAYYQGYTQVEIAEKLAIPLGTVKTKIRQAITKLKVILKENV